MSFTLDLKNFEKIAGERLDQVVQKTVLELFSNVLLKSPVDTGRFRANWNVSASRSDTSTSDDVDKSGASTISSAAIKINSYRAGPTIYITNALPYAQRLEYGWSKQAPAGMVRITLTEFQDYVKDAIRGLR